MGEALSVEKVKSTASRMTPGPERVLARMIGFTCAVNEEGGRGW